MLVRIIDSIFISILLKMISIYVHYISVENLSQGNSEIQIFSFIAMEESSCRSIPETEKIFLAEVNVQVLDSYSLGDHIIYLFKKYKHENWDSRNNSPRRVSAADGYVDEESSFSSESKVPTPSRSLKLYPSKIVHDTVISGAKTVVELNEKSPLMINVPSHSRSIYGNTNTSTINNSLHLNISSPPDVTVPGSELCTPRQLCTLNSPSRTRKGTVADNIVYESQNDTLLPLITSSASSNINKPMEMSYFMPIPTMSYALMYRIAGQLTYVNGASHVNRAERASNRLQGFHKVVISMRTVWNIDLVSVKLVLLLLFLFLCLCLTII